MPCRCWQAWCKFYELLSLWSVLPAACERGAPLRSLHLCEAPGAFITALNHYCVLSGVQEVSPAARHRPQNSLRAPQP